MNEIGDAQLETTLNILAGGEPIYKVTLRMSRDVSRTMITASIIALLAFAAGVFTCIGFGITTHMRGVKDEPHVYRNGCW